MVQLRTMLVPADNSGAKRLMIIGVPGRVGIVATLGDVVLCVVKGVTQPELLLITKKLEF